LKRRRRTRCVSMRRLRAAEQACLARPGEPRAFASRRSQLGGPSQPVLQITISVVWIGALEARGRFRPDRFRVRRLIVVDAVPRPQVYCRHCRDRRPWARPLVHRLQVPARRCRSPPRLYRGVLALATSTGAAPAPRALRAPPGSQSEAWRAASSPAKERKKKVRGQRRCAASVKANPARPRAEQWPPEPAGSRR